MTTAHRKQNGPFVSGPRRVQRGSVVYPRTDADP